MLHTLIEQAARLIDRASRDDGATAVEYGLLLAAITVAIAVTVLALGQAVDGMFANPDLLTALTPAS